MSKATIEETMQDFGLAVTVAAVRSGPSTVTYGLKLGPATRVEDLSRVMATLALRLGYEELRTVSPMPGTSFVGVEVPRSKPEPVRMTDVELKPGSSPLTVPLGISTMGHRETLDLATAPHLLVAGTTGSGKSVWLNAALSTILGNAGPGEVEMLMIDPKQVELAAYRPVAGVVTDIAKAEVAIARMVETMEDRYTTMREAGVRHADELGLPYRLIVVDELADLLMQSKTIEANLVRLAQKGRAARMHMILATQRPTAKVVTGLLKSNIPARLSFSVMSTTDSMVILDQPGAQTLVGKGDALAQLPGQRRPMRVQAPFITDEEVDEAVLTVTELARIRRTRPANHRGGIISAGRQRRRNASMSATELELHEAQ